MLLQSSRSVKHLKTILAKQAIQNAYIKMGIPSIQLENVYFLFYQALQLIWGICLSDMKMRVCPKKYLQLQKVVSKDSTQKVITHMCFSSLVSTEVRDLHMTDNAFPLSCSSGPMWYVLSSYGVFVWFLFDFSVLLNLKMLVMIYETNIVTLFFFF